MIFTIQVYVFRCIDVIRCITLIYQVHIMEYISYVDFATHYHAIVGIYFYYKRLMLMLMIYIYKKKKKNRSSQTTQCVVQFFFKSIIPSMPQ
jgi:hypothetical protein